MEEEGKIFATCLNVADIQCTVSGFSLQGGSPLYRPFPPKDLGNSMCPLDPPPSKIFNNGGGARGTCKFSQKKGKNVKIKIRNLEKNDKNLLACSIPGENARGSLTRDGKVNCLSLN